MKKILSMILVLSMLLTASAAWAEGMGVQVIGVSELETEQVSLDDFKLNTEATIEGYGVLCGTKFEVVDELQYGRKGRSFISSYESGADAEYALLFIDITNITFKDKNFLEEVSVKAVYDDAYEFGGWCHQFDHNFSTKAVIETEDIFPIEPMYEGHYVFGATLPNAVINGKPSLKLIITIDGNEITYNIRK